MQKNISSVERGISVALGALSLLPAFRRRKGANLVLRAASAAIGAGFLGRGLTGHCAVSERLGRDTSDAAKSMQRQDRAIVVNKAKEEVETLFELGGAPIAKPSLASLTLSTAVDGKRTRIESADGEHDWLQLRQLKAFLEAGEVPSVEGQSHGARSLLGKALVDDDDEASEDQVLLNGVAKKEAHA